jgi:hypothetical protein
VVLFNNNYFIMPNHDDLIGNHIHVDELTGRITGVVDRRDAKLSPLGMQFLAFEIILGIRHM